MKSKVKCPYCGWENNLLINPEKVMEQQIILCDCNEGGCDKYFAAFTEIKVQNTGKKIEGC